MPLPVRVHCPIWFKTARRFGQNLGIATALLAVVTTPRATESPMRIAFTGQALIQHDLRKTAPEKFAGIVAALRAHDVVFTDLETVIDTGRGAPTRKNEFFHAAPLTVLDCIREAGFNLLTLAGNHAFDLGSDGILGTREAVLARGFSCAGTGATLAEAAA